MATFSKKERIIASILSATPGLKSFLKSVYISLNAILHKKNYTIKLMTTPFDIKLLDPVQTENNLSEIFGGYYDNPTLNSNGFLLSHGTKWPSTKLPTASKAVEILLTNIHTKETQNIAKSSAYNWQQGSRLHWLNEDLFMYNDFNVNKQINQTKVFSLTKMDVSKTFDIPVQAAYKTDYFLSINYQRLLNMRPDYGYRNLPLLNDNELHDLKNDGIWKTDYETGNITLLHTLEEVVALEKKDIFEKCTHKVNHIIIQPDGKGFIFIHRYLLGKRRFDRLVYSDFNSLKVIIDEEYVSHCCWIDNETIFGYLKANGTNSYYYISIKDGSIKLCEPMSNLNLGDGHPSCFKDWIIFDSYPDKSRMQKLLLFNQKTKSIYTLAELYQKTKYKNETRCDLHPRFSIDGNYISFDTVYKNTRKQCIINIQPITALSK